MNRRKGFTLVEVIISALIFSMFIGFAVSFLIDGRRQSALATATGQIRVEAQNAIRSFEKDIPSCAAIRDEEKSDSAIEVYKAHFSKFGVDSLEINVLDDDEINKNKYFGIKDLSSSFKKITYTLENKKKLSNLPDAVPVGNLIRVGPDYDKDGNVIQTRRVVAKNIESFSVKGGNSEDGSEETDLMKNVRVSVTARDYVPGLNKEITYTNCVLVAIRQLQNKPVSPSDNSEDNNKKISRWRRYVEEE